MCGWRRRDMEQKGSLLFAMTEIILFMVLFAAVIVLIVVLVMNYISNRKAMKAKQKKEFTQEGLYLEISRLVAAEEYRQACELWKQYEPDERFSLSYKDLSDQYHYALALRDYIGMTEVCLSEVKAALERVKPEFRQANFYLKEVATLIESVCGTYIKPGNASAEYHMVIDPDGTADIQYHQAQNYMTVKYIRNEKVTWTIENGAIRSGKVSGGPYFLKLTPVEGGMQVEDRRQFGNDLEMCGAYAKQQ